MKNWLAYCFLIGVLSLQAATPNDVKDWWEKTIFYQIYPHSFMDANDDGIGDLKGVESKLAYLKETGIDAVWLIPIFESPMVDFGYDISNYRKIQPEYGTMEDFDDMIAEAKRLDIKIILDFVPNHSSDKCEWFTKSASREPGYEDYYVWHDGKPDPAGGPVLPPNNWQSVFYGSAWTFHPVRKQFYLHQFTVQQPDLNFRNPKVVEEMKDVLRFWLAKGVAGFRIDAVNHLFEVEDFRDEPPTGTDNDPLSYGYTHHWYTKDLPEVYDMIFQWREVLDDWKAEHNTETKIMMTEAYANITFTMKYFESEDGQRKGSHMPFNFLLITDLNENSTAPDYVTAINKWLLNMPSGKTANWVLGNHDNPRVGSRYGADRIDAMTFLLMTLPGAAVTYNGDEIGMVDYRDISWEDTVDPAACNTNPDVYKKFSRDPERTPFQWSAEKNAGFSKADKTWLPVNPNYEGLNLDVEKPKVFSHYSIYKRLAELRKEPSFEQGSFHVQALNNNVVAFVRQLIGHEVYVIIINVADQEEVVDLTVFAELPEKLTVVEVSSHSVYKKDDAVDTAAVATKGFDSLILRATFKEERFENSNPSTVKGSHKTAKRNSQHLFVAETCQKKPKLSI